VERNRVATRPGDGVEYKTTDPERHVTEVKTLGFERSCSHDAEPIPCTVLDPFMGAGTTGLVADRLQRNAIGFELSDEHTDRAVNRVGNDRPGGPGGLLDIMEAQP
jgi:hypothetical protein